MMVRVVAHQMNVEHQLKQFWIMEYQARVRYASVSPYEIEQSLQFDEWMAKVLWPK